MGWAGVVVLGVVVGLVGWWLHPLRARRRGGLLPAIVAGVAGAALARLAGKLSGAILDGEVLEWPVCTAVALVAVAVTVGLAFRRRGMRD